jgi:hypothetical protein
MGVPGIGGIGGVPGITGTEDAPFPAALVDRKTFKGDILSATPSPYCLAFLCDDRWGTFSAERSPSVTRGTDHSLSTCYRLPERHKGCRKGMMACQTMT